MTKLKLAPGQKLNITALRSLRENLGDRDMLRLVRQSFAEGLVKADNFSFQAIAEAIFPDWRTRFAPLAGGMVNAEPLEEAAVDSTMFANITGQILYSAVMDGWQEADRGVGDQLATRIPTKFNGEKIPGVGMIKDEEFSVPEGTPYPESGMGEQYVETPTTTKRGLIVSVTKEAVFFDRTAQVLMRAGEVGERLAMGKQKRILRVLIGITNNHKWNGTAFTSYLNGASDPWNNIVLSNDLQDWTDVEDAIVQKTRNKHPDTNNPIEGEVEVLVCSPAKLMTAKRIVAATEVQWGTTNAKLAMSLNPVAGMFSVIASAQYQALLVAEAKGISGSSGATITNALADATWILGRPKKAIWYMENWPITVVTAPPNSDAEFYRDVIAAYKASERGVAFMREPRELVRSISTATG